MQLRMTFRPYGIPAAVVGLFGLKFTASSFAPGVAAETPGLRLLFGVILLAGAIYFLTWCVRTDENGLLVYSRWPLKEQTVDLQQLTGLHLYFTRGSGTRQWMLAVSDREGRRMNISKPPRKMLGAIEDYGRQAGLSIRIPDKPC
jgi:hypothetical protein